MLGCVGISQEAGCSVHSTGVVYNLIHCDARECCNINKAQIFIDRCSLLWTMTGRRRRVALTLTTVVVVVVEEVVVVVAAAAAAVYVLPLTFEGVTRLLRYHV